MIGIGAIERGLLHVGSSQFPISNCSLKIVNKFFKSYLQKVSTLGWSMDVATKTFMFGGILH